ncbi:MAG: hypothetical protein ABIA59_02275, partial [Candidatus Latescibacterota bacterium]
MNKWILVICVFLMLSPILAQGATFPAKATYHLFTNGISTGSNTIETVEKNGRIIMTSVTHYSYEEIEIEMKSITEADAKTFTTLRVSYEGKRNNTPVSGHFVLDNDTLTGTMMDGENSYP